MNNYLVMSNSLEQIELNLENWTKEVKKRKRGLNISLISFLIILISTLIPLIIFGVFVLLISFFSYRQSVVQLGLWRNILEEKLLVLEREKLYNFNQKMRKLNSLEFNVAGISYKQKEAKKIAKIVVDETGEKYFNLTNAEIREMDEKVYLMDQSYALEVQFIPEPTNEFDKNAIQILCHNEILGYVPKDKIKEYNDFINKGVISKQYLYLKGGKFKDTSYDDKIEVDEWDFYAQVYLELEH